VGELPFEARLAVARHPGYAEGVVLKTRGAPRRRNSTAVPFIAYTWRGCNTDLLAQGFTRESAPSNT
jgi:hypothetical protein